MNANLHIGRILTIGLVLFGYALTTAAQDKRPDITLATPPIMEQAQVNQYGCTIHEVTHTVAVLNTKIGKYELQETYVEYELRVWMRDAETRETWHAEPAPYRDDDAAFADCKRWQKMMKKDRPWERKKK